MAGATGAAFRARRASGSAALKLLRAENMPVIAATCGRHLVEQRVLPYPEFVTLVAEDLAELRDDGFALPRTAQEYIADWIRDAILIRRATAAREETVELSPSAADAIGFIASIDQPRASVTSSRLANVSELLSTLARDTDPDPAHLVEALRRERDRIDQQIARVEQQGYVPLDDASAQERLAEVLRLADEVPRDFAKVAGSLEQLNQSLREQIVNHDGQRGGVLAEVFSGVDVIENSDAGRSFNAFYRLLLDPELIEGFDAAVDAVLQREFTNELPLAESAFLRQYLTTLQRESAQVRGTLTDLSRSLRRFVETQEYREHKRLADAIGRAEQVAMAVLRELPATHPLGLGLDLTSMTISSHRRLDAAQPGRRPHQRAGHRTPDRPARRRADARTGARHRDRLPRVAAQRGGDAGRPAGRHRRRRARPVPGDAGPGVGRRSAGAGARTRRPGGRLRNLGLASGHFEPNENCQCAAICIR